MDKHKVGILHPGDMGISVAATMKNGGHDVYWMSEGRSASTRARAEKVGLLDAGTLAALCATCSVIVSVCPPGFAEEVANSVLAQGFKGMYLDANAIAPQRAKHIGHAMTAAGIEFVDGGIIGGPAWKPGTTVLYLSGNAAEQAAGYFAAGPLETCVIGDEIGKASALKMCFAAYTKGTTALLAGVVAAAEALGVRDELAQQWSRDNANLAEENARRVQQVTAKAWRFEDEMYEIAATFEEAGLPDGFHQAAADIYQRMAGFKDASAVPSLQDVLHALLHPDT
jgi:3-hydroxyisobutyrate dehydrogenase-like beta-hydroxyacid dehydrogenase